MVKKFELEFIPWGTYRTHYTRFPRDWPQDDHQMFILRERNEQLGIVLKSFETCKKYIQNYDGIVSLRREHLSAVQYEELEKIVESHNREYRR